MAQFKKLVAGLLALVMTCTSLGVSIIASAATYSDTENHWAEKRIDLWSSRNVLSGYEDGTFRPDNTISRGEIVTILTKLIAFTDKGDISFADINGSEWYADAVLSAGNAGIISGDTDGNANAENAATREEAAALFKRAFNVEDDQNGSDVYSDASKISPWANGSVGGVTTAGYMTGYDGAFRPLDTITRAEFVALLDKSIEGYITEPGTYTADDFSKSKGVIIINAPDVVLDGVTADYAIVTPIADGTEINNSDIDRGVKNLSSTEVNADDSVVVDNSDKIVSQSTQTPTATDESVATEAPETTETPEKTTVPNATSSAATTKPNKTSSSSSGSSSSIKVTTAPTVEVTTEPTSTPTVEPTIKVTTEPTATPTVEPTVEVTTEPTSTSTVVPTVEVTTEPTTEPTTATPTVEPTAAPKATVTVSTIHDQSETISDTDLCDANSYKIEETTAETDTYRTITISATNLKKHTNAEQTKGYWVGATITAPEDRQLKAYSFSTTEPTGEVQFTPFDTARTSEPFYLDVNENDTKWVVVKYDNDTTETFKLDASGVELYQAPATVEKSTIHDQSTENPIDDTDLCDANSYGISETTASGETYRTIKISATNLKKHENGEGDRGYWVGATITAPEDRQITGYYFAVISPIGIPIFQELSARDSEPFYLDVNANKVKWLVVKYDNDTTETFKLDASDVTMYQAPATVTASTIHDQSTENPIDDTDLCDANSYGISETTGESDTYRTIKISATNLKKHTNGENKEGYWVGATITAPEDRQLAAYYFSTEQPSDSPNFTPFDTERDSEPFYLDVSENDTKWLVVKYDNDTTETFKLDASGVRLYGNIYIGDYVTMGTYNGEDILWRCVDIDENGPLMLADEILCNKAFDAKTSANSETGSHSRDSYRAEYYSNYWADSNIRSWLNSNAAEVEWLCGNPPSASYVTDNAYDQEAGFLTKFTLSQRYVMKSVTQKSLLAKPDITETTKGEALHKYKSTISDVIGDNYDSAYYEDVTDKMFLLDVKQLYAVYDNRSVLGDDYYIANSSYWLRSPEATYGTFVRYVDSSGSVRDSDAYFGSIGVRPAFYLNTDAVSIETGDGTEDTPYTIDGKQAEVSLVDIDENLYDKNSYKLEETTENTDDYRTIKISATNLKEYENGFGENGYWVGVTVTVPAGRTITGYYVSTSTSQPDSDDVEYTDVEGITGKDFCFNANEVQEQWVVVKYDNETTETFKLDASGVTLTTSYVVPDEAGTTLDAGTELLGNADLVEVKNASDVPINSCDITTTAGTTYSNYINLYTKDSVDFQTSSSGTYLEIKPNKSGTITFFVQEAEYEVLGESRTVGLYKMNELSSLAVDAEREELTDRVTNSMGYTVVVAVTAQLEAGQTYRLATEWSSVPFYGYTYTTEISDDTGNNEEVTEPNDDDDDTADSTVMSASYNVNENDGEGFSAGDTLGNDTSLIKVTTACDFGNSGLFFGFELDGNTYRQYVELYTPHYSLNEGIFQAKDGYTYLTIKPKKSGTLKLIAGRNRGNDVELYVKNDDNSYSLVDTTIEEVDSRDDIVTVTAHLEKGKNYVLTSTKTSNGVYGYTYEADLTETSYVVPDEAGTTLTTGTELLGNTDLVKVTNASDVPINSCNITLKDETTYSNYINLYTKNSVDFQTSSSGTYLEITPNKSGTITFIVQEAGYESESYTVGLYKMNELSSLAVDVEREELTDKVYDEWGEAYTVVVAVTAQLEAEQTYRLATERDSIPFYGYTYTTEISDDTGNNEEVTEPNDDDDDTADSTLMSTHYNVNDETEDFTAGKTLGNDTSLIKVINACEIGGGGGDSFKVDGETYSRCVELYTPHYSLNEGIFQADEGYTYLTIKPKKSGTITLVADRYNGNGVELFVKNDDNSYSQVTDTTITPQVTYSDNNVKVTVMAHLEKDKTYVLTSTKRENGVYGYTYEADTSTSYKVSGEANSDLDAGTLGDTSLIEVTNMKNVMKWSADEFTVDNIAYDRCVDLYTPTYDLDNGTFEMGDESYITINSKIDGTVTFIADRKVQDNVLYDMELFVKNEEDGSIQA
jgi:hypothetical protein